MWRYCLGVASVLVLSHGGIGFIWILPLCIDAERQTIWCGGKVGWPTTYFVGSIS